MPKHRVHTIEFKRHVCQEFASGETLYGLSRRHGICRNLIRVWVAKFEAGESLCLSRQLSCRLARLTRVRSRPSAFDSELRRVPAARWAERQ